MPAPGSVVRLGQAGAPAGAMTISGAIRAYSGIEMLAGTTASGSADVNVTASALIETLSGSMHFAPTGAAVLRGEFIARGAGSDITIDAPGTLEVRGSFTAQRNIVVDAGSAVRAGELSLHTFGTSHLTTLDSSGTITLRGVNDVLIDSSVSADAGHTGAIDIASTRGTLTLGKTSGRIEAGGQIVLGGVDVDVQGVIKNLSATAASYDDEVAITAARDLLLDGDFSLLGSFKAIAGRNLSAFNTTIAALATGQRLVLSAGGAVNLGSAGGHSGGLLLEADDLMLVSARGAIVLAADGQLYTAGDGSELMLQSDTLRLAGSLRAGAKADPQGTGWAFSGHAAAIELSAVHDMVLGDLASGIGGELTATGRVLVQTGSAADGFGLQMSGASRIVADATGAGLWSGAAVVGPGLVQLQSDGDIVQRGFIGAIDPGASIGIASRSQVFIGGLVQADDRLQVIGGTDGTHVAIRVDTLVVDAGGNYVSGGTLDAIDSTHSFAGGSIVLAAVDGVLIEGVVGQQDLGHHGKVGLVDIQSVAGDVTMRRDINVSDSVVITGGNLSAQQGSRVFASAEGSTVFMQARSSISVSAASGTGPNPAIIQAGHLVHLAAPTITVNGFVQATDAVGGRVLLSGGRTVAIGGTLVTDGNIEVQAGVDMSWTRERMQAPVLRADLLGGEIDISGQGALSAHGTIKLLAGGDMVIDADAIVGGSRSLTVQVVRTVQESVNTVTGTRQVDAGPVTVNEISWQPTTITQQVGTELVAVGSQFTTMDVALEQIGYYNAATNQFREVLVEGVDYLNNQVVWFNAADEQNPTRHASAVTSENINDSSNYRAFTQLDDAQRWAVLNTTGYKPLYQFSYANYVVHGTKNGQAFALTEAAGQAAPDWKNHAQKIYFVDVANWRDKYVVMPQGAQEDILALATQGQAQYLTGDTAADGSNAGGVWVASPAGATGELVGTYTDSARVRYDQAASVWTGVNPSTVSATDVSTNYDFDGRSGIWNVAYLGGTGQRTYNLATQGTAAGAGTLSGATVGLAPQWSLAASGFGDGTDTRSGGTRLTAATTSRRSTAATPPRWPARPWSASAPCWPAPRSTRPSTSRCTSTSTSAVMRMATASPRAATSCGFCPTWATPTTTPARSG
jgi:hypothetical protein